MNNDWTFISVNKEELAAASPEEKQAAEKFLKKLLEEGNNKLKQMDLNDPRWANLHHLLFEATKLYCEL